MENKRLTENDIIDILAISIVALQGSELLTKITEMAADLLEYKKLEEELGCPLEVVAQLFKQDFIYFKYLGNVQTMEVKVIKGLSHGSNLGWHFTCVYNNLDFIYISLKDYKKTWWLREDRG